MEIPITHPCKQIHDSLILPIEFILVSQRKDGRLGRGLHIQINRGWNELLLRLDIGVYQIRKESMTPFSGIQYKH